MRFFVPQFSSGFLTIILSTFFKILGKYAFFYKNYKYFFYG